MQFFEVKFYDGIAHHSRILEVHDIELGNQNTVVEEVLDYYNAGYNNILRLLKTDKDCIKKLAKQYYTKYCKINKLNIEDCRLLSTEQVAKYSMKIPIDKHSYTIDYYHYRAILYAEQYGVINYKVSGKYIIYNQNYNNRECVGGIWRDKPCTYQRTANLDTGEVQSVQLKRLQRNGWNNV